ncbi:MAG: glycosyltransferase family 4 protein [Lachnospiraceae bacterium]|nr:glycosyltransferase family 4 protein [Lachnospiraceae bacterium]
MKVFLIGDYRSGTGPANVTLQYKNRMKYGLILRAGSKACRAVEMLLKMPFCDVVLLSGHSKQNLLALDLAHRFRKKTAFLMHGCVEHENAINGVPSADMTETEKKTLAGADAVYAVSERFADWLKERYPAYADKISAMPNGLEPLPVCTGDAPEKIRHRLISIGGGMPRKQIRYIAEAVMLLKEEPAYADAELVVIGDKGLDTDALNAFPCVQNLGLVSYAETLRLLQSAELFIQNSCFETFGLAPLEALSMGDSLLLSKEVGALELFSHTEEGDLITDTKNPEEIAGKIKGLLESGNHDRLLSSIDMESVSWNVRYDQLMRKLQELTKG